MIFKAQLMSAVAEEPAAKANGLLWSCLVSAMSPDVVAANALELAQHIEEAEPGKIAKIHTHPPPPPPPVL